MTHEKAATAEKICFVISPIGEADSDTRKRADLVLKYVIRPAVEACGYKAVRADEIDKPGMITSQVIQHVVSDPLVVADLTERNPNVFYELAIRHALRTPLVQIIRKGEAIPFDVAGTRTISVDHKDLESVECAKNDIMSQIKALEKDSSAQETPISVSLDLQILKQSDKPEDRSLADLVAAVSDLRAGLVKIDGKIAPHEQLAMLLVEIRSMVMARMEEGPEGRMSGGKRRQMSPRALIHMVVNSPMGRTRSAQIAIAAIASEFRDSVPWLYEVGMDAYRTAVRGDTDEARVAVREFQSALEMTLHGPWSRDIFRGKDMFPMLEEIEPMLSQLISDWEKPDLLDEETTHAKHRVATRVKRS